MAQKHEIREYLQTISQHVSLEKSDSDSNWTLTFSVTAGYAHVKPLGREYHRVLHSPASHLPKLYNL